jgi:hypothetical protein
MSTSTEPSRKVFEKVAEIFALKLAVDDQHGGPLIGSFRSCELNATHSQKFIARAD